MPDNFSLPVLNEIYIYTFLKRYGIGGKIWIIFVDITEYNRYINSWVETTWIFAIVDYKILYLSYIKYKYRISKPLSYNPGSFQKAYPALSQD